MKIRFLVITAVLATAILCSAGSVKAVTIQELMDQIASLQAQLKAMQEQQGPVQQTWCHTFNKNLGYENSDSNEVWSLHTTLHNEGISYGSDGPNEYGEGTMSAVVEFQEKYASEILTPFKLKHGTGFVGKSTRAKLNALYGCKDKKECVVDTDCPQYKCASGDTKCSGSVYKCVDGKCVTKPTSTTCTDSDGGLNYYVSGKAVVNTGGDSIDRCEGINTLVEAYCVANSGPTNSLSYTCPNGCENGACKKDLLQPYITVISPNGGETYKLGSSITVNWKTANVSSTEKFSLIRLRAYPNGREYNLIEGGVLNDGQEVITIPSSVPEGAYTLEIKSYIGDILLFDASDSYFKIVSTTTQSSITVTSPNGGEIWTAGTWQKVKWNSIGIPATDLLTIRLMDTNGSVVRHLVENITNDGSEDVIVSSTIQSGLYKIEVNRTKLNEATVADSSDNYFTISANSQLPTASYATLIGNQSTYTPGQTIKFSVKGVTFEGNPGTSEKGFNVQAYICKNGDCNNYLTPNPAGSYNGIYNSSTGYWDVSMIAPSDTTATYTMKVAFYCSRTPQGESQYGQTAYCSDGQIDKTFIFNITPSTQPSITVTSPKGGEVWEVGETHSITWKSNAITILRIELASSASSSGTRDVIINNVNPSTGSYSWTLSATTTPSIANGGSFKVVLVGYDQTGVKFEDFSENYFTIAPATTYCPQLYAKLTASYQKSCGEAGYDFSADINKDKTVGFEDVSLYSANMTNETWCQQKLSETTSPCTTSYNTNDNSLASISDSLAKIMEQIKAMLNR